MVQRAYRYRFYPTSEQASVLSRTFGCARLVYNRALAVRMAAWQAERKQERAKKESEALAAAVKPDLPLAKAAGDKGLTLLAAVPLSRLWSETNAMCEPSSLMRGTSLTPPAVLVTWV